MRWPQVIRYCWPVLTLSGCSGNGEEAAAQWIRSQSLVERPGLSALLPGIVDTPPAAYNVKDVVDPFLPTRILKLSRRDEPRPAGFFGRIHFSEAALETLRVVGFLEVQGQYVGVLEGAAGYGNARIGDRLGREQAEVMGISAKGIRLRQTDGPEFWMPISKRSR